MASWNELPEEPAAIVRELIDAMIGPAGLDAIVVLRVDAIDADETAGTRPDWLYPSDPGNVIPIDADPRDDQRGPLGPGERMIGGRRYYSARWLSDDRRKLNPY